MAERNESDLTAEPFQMVNSPAEYASAPEEPHGANPSAAAHDSAARIRETENTAPVHASGKTRLASPPLAEPTFLSRLYDLLALGGLLILSLILLAQVLPGLPGTRALWFPDELRQADILRGLLRGEWFELYLNGEPYQQIPPLYFWLMAALHKGLALVGLYVGEDIAPLLFTGTALSGLLMLWAVFALASGAARLDRRGSFAAGCVLLSAFGSFFHYANPDLLFAALVILSQTLLYQGLIRRRAPLRLGLAFACTALAIMTKGWLGLYLPLLSAALFCLWSGRPWRLFKPDFLFGLLFALLPALIWLGYIWTSNDTGLVIRILQEEIWQKAMGYAASSPWWYYLAALPLFWLPWSLLPPLHIGGGLFRGLKNARREENQGLAFVWIALLGGLALLSTLNYKEPAHLLPLLGPLAVLSGRGVLGLSPLRSLILQRLIALIFLASAAALALLPLYYSGNMPAALLSWLRHLPLPVLEIKPAGLFALPVIMLAGFVLCLGTVKARRPENLLLLVPLICTLFSYPLLRFTLPSLSENLSPQKVSQIIKQETENGFEPLAVNAPAWAFSYYAGHNIAQAQNRDEAMERAQSGAKLLLITPLEESAAWLKDGLFRETLRFWLFSSEYALMARLDSPEEETPPEVMEENAPPEESVEPEEIEENLEQEETEKYSVPEGTEKMEKMSNI